MAERFDLVVHGATVFDGTGTPGAVADVAVRDGRIIRVGEIAHGTAGEDIDAAGLALAPGFIDVHTHDDRALIDSAMSPKTSQGVTSVVVGNCGVSLAPLTLDGPPPPPLDLIGNQAQYAYPKFADYMDKLGATGICVNAACLCGHSTLRAGVMDDLDRPATKAEIGEMKRRLDASLSAGAVGFSTGLDYAPAKKAPREEIEQLAGVCAAHGGIYPTHIRNESDHMIEALDEAFTIGRTAGLPVLISHFKCSGKANFGKAAERLAFLDAARKDQDISLDAYPYAASSTVLKPDYVAEAKRVLITWSTPHPEMGGRELADIAADWQLPIEQAAERLQPAGAVYFAMDEDDVQRILAHADTLIGSDGLPHDAHPHPRLWGTFPRVLGHYAREEKLFSLHEAVRRMTSLPARRFGLHGRGIIAEGAHADLVLFDPHKIIDTATFADPKQPAAGIHRVWVNGTPVWDGGKSTGARPGNVLTGPVQ
jgi:N-acyl-D-amino-acid deacylase